jgi:hypothetical protein
VTVNDIRGRWGTISRASAFKSTDHMEAEAWGLSAQGSMMWIVGAKDISENNVKISGLLVWIQGSSGSSGSTLLCRFLPHRDKFYRHRGVE